MESNIEQYGAYAYGASLMQLRNVVPMVDEGGKSTWVHIAPYGRWKGHEMGDFVIDDKVLDTIIANYERQITPSMVDYEHDSLDDRKHGPKLAAGWIQKLEKRDNGLWAFIEFVPRAVEYIQSGEIRFVSPAIDFKSRDRKTDKMIGPELVNIALTNMPFLDGLTPIKLTRFAMGETIKTTETKITEQPAQLELSEEEMQAQDTNVDANAAIEAIAAASGLEPAAVVAGLLENQEQIAAMLTGGAEEEGTPAEEEEMAATDKQSDKVIAASVLESVKDKTIAQLSRRLEQLEKKQRDEEDAAIEALVNAKIEQGYITDDLKAEALFLFKKDRAAAEKVFNFKRVPIDVDQAGDENVDVTKRQLTKQEEAIVDGIIACSQGAGLRLTREDAIKKMIANKSN